MTIAIGTGTTDMTETTDILPIVMTKTVTGIGITTGGQMIIGIINGVTMTTGTTIKGLLY